MASLKLEQPWDTMQRLIFCALPPNMVQVGIDIGLWRLLTKREGAVMSDPAQSMVDNLPQKTGRTLEEWFGVLDGTGLTKHTELMNHLKTDHGVSHARTVRTGLREVAMHDWIFSVNGERLFLKGANLAPTALRMTCKPALAPF